MAGYPSGNATGNIFITRMQFQCKTDAVNTSRVQHATEPILKLCYVAL